MARLQKVVHPPHGRKKILTRWSRQDYPLNMASASPSTRDGKQSFQSGRGINTCSIVSNRSLHQGSAWLASLCVFVPVYRCVLTWSWKGYSNKRGLSFDPAAFKHAAPPTFVLSCIPTSVMWLKYHCTTHKHLL